MEGWYFIQAAYAIQRKLPQTPLYGHQCSSPEHPDLSTDTVNMLLTF